MSIKDNLITIANKTRMLLGLTGKMGLNAIATNLTNAQTQMETQSDLLDIALEAINDRSAGSPFTKAKLFTWTAPKDVTADGGQIQIPHSLGIEPDGYLITCEEMSLDAVNGVGEVIMFCYDSSWFDDVVVTQGVWFGFGASLYYASGGTNYIVALPAWLTTSKPATNTHITVGLTTVDGANSCIIPAGKRYNVLVYKR